MRRACSCVFGNHICEKCMLEALEQVVWNLSDRTQLRREAIREKRRHTLFGKGEADVVLRGAVRCDQVVLLGLEHRDLSILTV